MGKACARVKECVSAIHPTLDDTVRRSFHLQPLLISLRQFKTAMTAEIVQSVPSISSLSLRNPQRSSL